MASDQNVIDLFSDKNEILLNPRWPRGDYQQLWDLAVQAQQELALRGHVWIATSGSTAESLGSTKLVALSKEALLSSANSVNVHLQASSQDVWTQVLPHFHVGGLGIEVRASLVKAKVVPALHEGRWDVHHFYKILHDEKCTLSALVPTQVYDLVSHNFKAPPSLRAIVVGGGAFELELYRRARELGWPVLPSYGMTETASQIATASLQSLTEESFPSLGLLSHAKVQTNAEGFLQVQGSSLLTCYAQQTEYGNKCWDPKVNGWFTTEDKGQLINGALHIEGRSKDYVKIGGEGTNVAHLRSVLENCALQIDVNWPSQVALMANPSDRLGHEIHLASTLSSEDTERVVQLYTHKVLPFEKIRKIYYVQEIPRSDLGKIMWGELRRRL